MNAEQIEHCIQKHGDQIYGFCCFLTRSRDLADDLYQESFLVALEDTRMIIEGMEKKFLIGIAANLWKNQWRKEKRRNKIAMPIRMESNRVLSEAAEKESCGKDPLDTYIGSEEERMVMKIVDQLPERYRTIVLMYYSGQLSTKEIAEELHMSKGTVTSRLKRGREKIKKGLEELGYER